MWPIVILLSIPVIAILAWMLWKRTSSDSLQLFTDRRRDTSRLVSRGEFVDGSRHMPVALALTDAAFFYENSDMQASLERQWIHEVEYDDELSTGQSVGDGTVLRLRCFSQKFEFVLPADTVRQWEDFLPPHRMSAAETAAGA
ncbi:MAG TPA: hypothetical protein VER58_20330 [Thermoanaerobaculia bacterium]|nr:hypothetical protein [Thermoanaerobaculia bacterium]